MQYQTLDQIRQRCADELPGFNAVNDDALLRAWVWDCLRDIDTYRIGEEAQAYVKVVKGKGELPKDFLGIRGIIRQQNSVNPIPYRVVSGNRYLTGGPDGDVLIHYYALPLDEEGYPYILDELEQAVMAYVEWKFMALAQKKLYMINPYGFRIDSSLNRENERKAYERIGQARGSLNMLTPEEAEGLRIFRQQLTTYRNA